MIRGLTPHYVHRVQPSIVLVDDEESIPFAMRGYFTVLGYQADCTREQAEEYLIAYAPVVCA
jgi:hypothetical protein